MENRFPMNSGWVETPKLRKRTVHQEKKKASSVPTTPSLQQNNHFEPLSPPSTNKKKKKKRPRTHSSSSSNRSPLSQEITNDVWDDHVVPCNEMEGLHTTAPPPVVIETLRQISFLDYLKDELTVADFDSAQELKRERVTNFLAVPAAIEKLMAFGFFVCLDSFLYTFSILPLRFCLAFYHYVIYIFGHIQLMFGQRRRCVRLRPSQKCDLLKGFMIIITCIVMWSLDPSRIYHSIRGQAVLKLYVVFNVLEICDKLCCSVGVDILDALFSKSTLGNSEEGGKGYAKRQLKPITLFCLATGYMIVHTSVLFFQMITLNVAINFYSNALLSLLISNQFVEIKQSVFKKFEKENLFQLTCSDIVERFQQCAFLFIITLRNVIELSESGPSSILPSTFVPLFKLPASTSLNTLMTPVVMVIVSELMVDWLKHAFITKFNQIRPSIYGKYIDVLCKDLVIGSPGRMSGRNHAFVDQSPVVSRRIGFPVLPLACLYVRMMQQILPMMFMSHNTPDAATTSSFTSVITKYLMDYGGGIHQLLPVRIQLVVVSMVKQGWLEHGLDKLFGFITWTLVVAILALILLALKVLVGINLLGFAYRRFCSMEERERDDLKKDKEMKEMSKDETEYAQSVRDYLNNPDDNILGATPVKYTLDNVDRFSMVKSRIP
ncbi:eukaryotic membrane protein family-domain-containing protein [Mucor mucedo]|uniref:eukaryotic membrane protein family-domain-containing protein n=1 Tax=Mucor mucedo TaxID=29922 RepID=UPI0022204105|nr:eukaryotic membrane protein family-domain-containing protein [Mucor mucedo]KAI7890398.1 eukaryotic membrane protein family-domain-containing protein [Mucor mucedo]